MSSNLHQPLLLLITAMRLATSSDIVLDPEYCGISTKTRRTVEACPVDEASWLKAANEMSCSDYDRKCNGNLKYHCLINPWQNETVQVCAPPTRIRSGYCAEYNTRGGKIQEFYIDNCKACSRDYQSTEAYKYQECYSQVYKLKQGQRVQSTHNPDRQVSTQGRHDPQQQGEGRMKLGLSADSNTNTGSNVHSKIFHIYVACILQLITGT